MVDGMGLIQLYSTTKTSQTNTSSGISSSNWHEKNAAFCNCSRNANDDKQCCGTRRASDSSIALGICRCGEDTCKIMNWGWDKQLKQEQTIFIGETVSFHPCYSQGTSVVRGECELEKNRIHYWEVKIVHWFSGTDLMIGIGTDQVDVFEHQYKFSSVLGIDSNSWGFSHRGVVQHKNIRKCYGKSYTKQWIVGVYLDLFRGHLEFYVNRIPQGTAYRNIPTDKSTPIYPMACSTSARSSVRLINASSFPECLQFRCMKVITKYPQLIKTVQQMPGLSSLCESLWYMFPKERYSYKSTCQDSRTASTDNGCISSIDNNSTTSRCSANASSTVTKKSDCDKQIITPNTTAAAADAVATTTKGVDGHDCMDYDGFGGLINDAIEHDYNDSMEDDLFAATIHSVPKDGGSDTDDML